METPVANRSKRFHKGSIHQLQGGKIRILERFKNDEDNYIYLRYEYVDAVPRQEIINKERNVSANIYKFAKMQREENGEQAIIDEEEEIELEELLVDISTKLYDIQSAQEANTIAHTNSSEETKLLQVKMENMSAVLGSNIDLAKALNTQTTHFAILSERYAKQSVQLDECRNLIKSQQETIEKLTTKLSI